MERKGAKAGGDTLHVQADPSRAELERKTFEKKKADLEAEKKRAVLEKYGAQAREDDDDKKLRSHAATSETYREFGADGKVTKGAPLLPKTSKYAEDVYESNHTAVWGSFFDVTTMRWGYADDHSTQRHSYSTGEAGRLANDAARRRNRDALDAAPVRAALPSKAATSGGDQASADAANRAFASRNAVYGEADKDLVLDEAKVQAAIAKEKAAKAKDADDRKRKYNSFATTDVTPEDMEAYRRTKVAHDDPMAKFLE